MAQRQRPDVNVIVDGREITAPEGTMLVDAAKRGDIEIPVFCYEPKLGPPVGACRMCLVEIEGIPKLQTGCSTAIRDGMVVHTRTERVKEAQNAIVEFLLINHPLDCPVCDKGGECPLQDIAMGWGPGRSRMVDPKRHFVKPIPLSPLVRIDRERCILCYRCVRFSQEVSEDEQLQLLERGDASYVGTFDDRPYVSRFHGNIIELCPVGALTSQEYRFRARPWDIEDAGTICTLCPSQCNVKVTVRDEKVARVLARDNPAVDDGWLCDKGRFGYQMMSSPDRRTTPLVREGGAVRETGWAEALDRIAEGLAAAGPRTAVLAGGTTSNEEAYLLQRIARRSLGSPHLATLGGPEVGAATLAALGRPGISASMQELGEADAILVIGTDPGEEMPIAELRIRKAVRREKAKLAIASERPTRLEEGPAIDAAGPLAALRYAPGEAAGLLEALAGSAGGREGLAGALERVLEAVGGRRPDEQVRELAAMLGAAERPVIVWGERMLRGSGAERAAAALLALAEALGIEGREGAGLLGVPVAVNARGLREVGCASGAGPGLEPVEAGMSPGEIRAALESGDLDAIVLWDADPVRDLPDSEGWSRALGAAKLVVSVSMFATASATHADVHLPLESYAERDGTITHPDGRLQRLRPGVPRPGSVRPLWQALCELAERLGDEIGFGAVGDVTAAIAAEVPFYAGLGLDQIPGRGVRWLERDAAAAYPEKPAEVEAGEPSRESGQAEPAADGSIAIATYRPLWAGEVTEHNPALRFLAPEQRLELSPTDAERLGLGAGEHVEVRSNGHRVGARVAVRSRMRAGTAFLSEGTTEDNANLLAGARAAEISSHVGAE